MAKIVLGIGTSHSPVVSLPPELWSVYGEEVDKNNRELVWQPEGHVLSYEEGLARAKTEDFAKEVTPEAFKEKHARVQKAVAGLAQSFKDAKPDVVVIVGDDQDEWFFEDNMPTFSIYWGDKVKVIPKTLGRPPNNPREMLFDASAWALGEEERDVEVASDLGRYLVEYMMEHDFDVSHFTYTNELYGGSVARRYPTPTGELDYVKETKPRRQGIPHAWAFVIRRIMENAAVPIVPVFVNTCYPPNQPTSKRCFDFGQAIRGALEEWGGDSRVAVMASGGLSHFTTDEVIDRMLLDALRDKDAKTLRSLPKSHLYSAASEILNWVVLGGAVEHLECDILDYLPIPRTIAGTGVGWGFVRWT